MHATALWAPDIKALFAGDLVFNQVFLWLGEHRPENVQAWKQALDTLAALQPDMVVAGHAKPGLPNDASGIAFSRAYLEAWPKLVALAKDLPDLQARVKAAFPDAIDVLNDFILPNSADVAKGVQPVWTE